MDLRLVGTQMWNQIVRLMLLELVLISKLVSSGWAMDEAARSTIEWFKRFTK